MVGTSRVAYAARMVRAGAATIAAGLFVGFIAVSSFAGQPGLDQQSPQLDPAGADTVLTAAVAQQERAGLRCSGQPIPASVVLFQRHGDTEVALLSFEQAVEASAAREGVIRGFCSRP